MVVHKIAIYKLMKKPTPATITSARFYASGSSMNQDSGIVFPVFCNKLHLPLLCYAGTKASIKKKNNQKTKQERRVCCWLSASFLGGGGEAEDADQTAGRHRRYLPPPPWNGGQSGEQLQQNGLIQNPPAHFSHIIWRLDTLLAVMLAATISHCKLMS